MTTPVKLVRCSPPIHVPGIPRLDSPPKFDPPALYINLLLTFLTFFCSAHNSFFLPTPISTAALFFTTHYPCLGNFPTASLFFDSLDDVVDTRSSAILRPRSHLRRCFSANASLCHQARLRPVANGSSSCRC